MADVQLPEVDKALQALHVGEAVALDTEQSEIAELAQVLGRAQRERQWTTCTSSSGSVKPVLLDLEGWRAAVNQPHKMKEETDRLAGALTCSLVILFFPRKRLSSLTKDSSPSITCTINHLTEGNNSGGIVWCPTTYPNPVGAEL